MYKIIAKILSERLKSLLPSTITEQQSAFVANWQILDASFIANEIIDEWKRKKRKEKVWLSSSTMKRLSTNQTWQHWIRGCLCSANSSVIINGRPRGKIIAFRDLRKATLFHPVILSLHFGGRCSLSITLSLSRSQQQCYSSFIWEIIH